MSDRIPSRLPGAFTDESRSVSRMHRPTTVGARFRSLVRRRMLHLLGLIAVLPLVAVDPTMIVLLYDVEFLAIMGSVGVALLRGDLRVVWLRLYDSNFATEVRAAVRLTREQPRSLLEC